MLHCGVKNASTLRYSVNIVSVYIVNTVGSMAPSGIDKCDIVQ